MRRRIFFIVVGFISLCCGLGFAKDIVLQELTQGDVQSHVFLENQSVQIAVPESLPTNAVSWQLINDQHAVFQKGIVVPENKTLDLGKLDIGWYRLEWLDDQSDCLVWTTAAVLKQWKTLVPDNSPVCVDAAISWLGQNDPVIQKRLAHLAALAGVNWIRDRLRWRELEPERNHFAKPGVYDKMAALQHSMGMNVLQVFHDTPKWARNAAGEGGFPPDLRDAYIFCREMAKRFKGEVGAWEPWNEANSPNFGGHPTHEICSYQKAAYLGFKAGDPGITVGFNAYCGVPTKLYSQTVLQNEAWAYFDTYNFHSYSWPHSYGDLWDPIHEVAGGKPLWLTETDRGMKYETDSPTFDFSFEGDLRKAEYITQEYALAMYEGVSRVFHFILGSYTEPGGVQFGLLRFDLTPRPAYLALATLGRILAGAHCLGKVDLPGQAEAKVYAYRALHDNKPVDVLIAWAEKNVDWPGRGKERLDWMVPDTLPIQGIYDYLGRPLTDIPDQLKPAPIYLVLKKGGVNAMHLIPKEKDQMGSGDRSPIVMQCRLPRKWVKKVKNIPWSEEWEYVIDEPGDIDLPIEFYNFGAKKVKGLLLVEHLPASWRLDLPVPDMELDPMERKIITARLDRSSARSDTDEDNWIILRGEFGDASRPVLAFRITRKPGENYPE